MLLRPLASMTGGRQLLSASSGATSTNLQVGKGAKRSALPLKLHRTHQKKKGQFAKWCSLILAIFLISTVTLAR
jgi:hypothetical protein